MKPQTRPDALEEDQVTKRLSIAPQDKITIDPKSEPVFTTKEKEIDRAESKSSSTSKKIKESSTFRSDGEGFSKQTSNQKASNDKSTAKEPVKKVATKPTRFDDVDEEGAKSGWVIQVAAFQERGDADKVDLQITRAGFPSYIYRTKINGQTWYRINVGPFSTVTEATNFKQSQKVHTKFKGAFVRKL